MMPGKLIQMLAMVVTLHASAAPPSSHALFLQAIKNDSTTTNYVLIHVVNDKTGATKLVCTGAPFLLGALHMQHNLKYDAVGSQKALALASSQSDLVFHFTKSAAIKNLAQYHTPEQVAEMRAALKPYSNRQLPALFKGDGKGLDPLYMADGKSSYQGAIAQVLLERGLLPERQCFSGALTVAR